jgi:Ca2+-binding EF-hand superfamily protein
MTRRHMIAALASAASALTGLSFAQDKANVPPQADRLTLAMENAKQLLMLMDMNKNGKISKQEWMNFMSAEFDRLDSDHSGELDPHELLRSSVQTQRIRYSDQGK